MPSKDQEIQDFFILVQKGINKHGYKEIARTIQFIDLQKNNMFFHEIYNFIIELVLSEFKIYQIKESDLYGNARGVATTARMIAIIVAKNHLKISDEQLAAQFDRTRQVVYNFRMEFLKIQREGTTDKLFLKKYDIINKKVVKYIKKIKGEENGKTQR